MRNDNARRYAAQFIAWGTVASRDPWDVGPGLGLNLSDLIQCARADAAQRGLKTPPPCHHSLEAVLRDYADRLLAGMGEPRLSDDEINAAVAEIDEHQPTRSTRARARFRDAEATLPLRGDA